MDFLMVVLDGAVRESMLFAATWFLIGGVDDLGVDLCFFVDRLRHWQAPHRWVSDLPGDGRCPHRSRYSSRPGARRR